MAIAEVAERPTAGQVTLYASYVDEELELCPHGHVVQRATPVPDRPMGIVIFIVSAWPIDGTPIDDVEWGSISPNANGSPEVTNELLSDFRRQLSEQSWALMAAFLCHAGAMLATASGQEELATQLNTLGGALMVLWAVQQRQGRR